MQVSLIIAAGGTGTRFKKSLPKQGPQKKKVIPSKLFIPLRGKPLLIHTLESFASSAAFIETLIAAPRGDLAEIRALIKRYKIRATKVVQGGASRALSVLNAVKKANKRSDWVMVHDGARPFVSVAALKKLVASTKGVDGAILAKKVVPTIKEADKRGCIKRTIDRTVLFEAETPQLVKRVILMKAYQRQSGKCQATDEASLLESVGAKVKLVSHEEWNPKITTIHDFQLAEAALRSREPVPVARTGFGKDLHRMVRGRKLMLGGVYIPHSKGALGHSDGDALLHAITDAILGATGAGDIGEWFSNKKKKFKDIASSKILSAVFADAVDKGWQVDHVDSVITLERPKLGRNKLRMRKKIATLLNIATEDVSVKAKTQEGLGPEGEGLAVSCEAFVTLRRN